MADYYQDHDDVEVLFQENAALISKLERMRSIKRELEEDQLEMSFYQPKKHEAAAYPHTSFQSKERLTKNSTIQKHIAVNQNNRAIKPSSQNTSAPLAHQQKTTVRKRKNEQYDLDYFISYLDSIHQKARQLPSSHISHEKEIIDSISSKANSSKAKRFDQPKYDKDSVLVMKDASVKQRVNDESSGRPAYRLQMSKEGGAGVKLLRLSVYVLFFTVVTAIGLFIFSARGNKTIMGYYLIPAASSAMSGTEETKAQGLSGSFGSTAMLGIKSVEPSDIKIGDIITFHINGDRNHTLTSRVVDIQTELNGQQGLFFTTRQDNSGTDNPQIPAEFIVGKKEFAIPLLGSIITVISNYIWGLMLSIVLIACLAIVIRYYFRLYVHTTAPIRNVRQQVS